MSMIDRDEERDRLRGAAEEAPQLVVMRGRRRVGKSYLINETFDGDRFIYFQAEEGEEAGHLDLFAAAVGELTGAPLDFSSWDAALDYVGSLAADSPLVVALDEFQWLQAAQPQLDSKIMRNFDAWKRARAPLTLVLSGSAISLMEQLLEGNKPMYGRADYRPLIEPFDYRTAALFGPSGASSEAKLRRFGVLGGTAQYQAWAGAGPLGTILADRILAPGAPLGEEPLQLIRGEDGIREPGSYYEILRVVAGGVTQQNEIAQRSRVSSPQLLQKRLRRLQDLRYVERREPVGGNGTAVWEITDPFFAFWFRYVYPNRSRLEMGRAATVRSEIEADLDNHMGWVFERICRTWAAGASPAAAFADADQVGGFWTRTHDVEVDVVARKERRYTALGSCKWSTQADTHALDDLIAARDSMKGAGAAELFVFARGFTEALIDRAAREGVTLVDADQLFA